MDLVELSFNRMVLIALRISRGVLMLLLSDCFAVVFDAGGGCGRIENMT